MAFAVTHGARSSLLILVFDDNIGALLWVNMQEQALPEKATLPEVNYPEMPWMQ